MKVYTNTTFDGLWPVGTSAVVVAKDAEMAAELLNEEVERLGLAQDTPIIANDMEHIKTRVSSVKILQDGNY